MKLSAAEKAVAIVGVGALMPDAPNAPKFWQNVREGCYSIKEVVRERWDPNLYYDSDPKAPDKTYSKIGGWVRDWEWDPLKWKLPIPPRVSLAMDLTQKWAVVTAREALSDYGYPGRPLNAERTAVILGNAMAGDTHLYSAARILFPEFAEELIKSSSYSSLPLPVRQAIMEQLHEGVRRRTPPITEDTMPGELANIVAGRIAALYDFKGPNFVADAACASAMAAMSAAIEGLTGHDYDSVLTGGIDTNMSPSTFVKFCKIGALSATGTRPYAAGADGFVMGEGAVTFLLKRLADAERDGDRIYAVIRGFGGSSDGKGKGITAPNPAGQKICIRRAWQNAGVTPSPGDMIEGHGTSTPVGDVAEFESLTEAFKDLGLPAGSVALGSVKSNIGHLKGAAGAAGILKAMFALKEKELPPSLNFNQPNPNIDFAGSPFYVNTKLKPWEVRPGQARRAAVSAFGFGGTNFHIVMEEYLPGRIAARARPRLQNSKCPYAEPLCWAQSRNPHCWLESVQCCRKRLPEKRPLQRPPPNRISAQKCGWPSTTGMPLNSPTKSGERSRRLRRIRPAGGRLCAPKAFSWGKVLRPKWLFCLPDRVPNTSICSSTSGRPSLSSPKFTKKPIAQWSRCSGKL
jgi:acyl transferase domain-containing protein